MTQVAIWETLIPLSLLSKAEVNYVNGAPKELPPVEWVFNEMNSVWEALGLDNNRSISNEEFKTFYSHPVWLLNGIFSASDTKSTSHRLAIAQFLKVRKLKMIADYGGGYGELARIICDHEETANVDIIEPFPSKVAIFRLQHERRISFVSELESEKYEAIVAQDVLEHVIDPVSLAFKISSAVEKGGYVIFANCFYPVIECHLPCTFHLRFTFPYVMRALGLKYVCCLDGAEHVQVFQRGKSLFITRARILEKLSSVLGPMINFIIPILVKYKRVFLGSKKK